MNDAWRVLLTAERSVMAGLLGAAQLSKPNKPEEAAIPLRQKDGVTPNRLWTATVLGIS